MSRDKDTEPDFRGGRERLEQRIRTQLTIDAYNMVEYPIPKQLQEKWEDEITFNGHSEAGATIHLLALSPSQRDELARDLAEWHARTGTHRYYTEIQPAQKRARGEAA
jgi:hypothetical protein